MEEGDRQRSVLEVEYNFRLAFSQEIRNGGERNEYIDSLREGFL